MPYRCQIDLLHNTTLSCILSTCIKVEATVNAHNPAGVWTQVFLEKPEIQMFMCNLPIFKYGLLA